MNTSPIRSESPTAVTPKRPALGLPFIALAGLALLSVPRVILHDVGLIHEGTFVNLLLVVIPPIVWITIVLWRRVPNPFLTLFVIGACSGVFLAIVHQVLWAAAFGDQPPALGGNLAQLDPTVQDLIIRGFAVVSSLFTGVLIGVVVGLIGWGVGTALKRGGGR
ncbi:MAG TPA: hypothetical protein VI121_01865 [Agromyces sp.]